MSRDPVDNALAAFDRALADSADHIQEDLAQAVRCVVELRNRLIDNRRRGVETGNRLDRVNAVLSHTVAGEYPLEGIRRKRIEHARDELAEIFGRG